jgi:hypothetical protein
MAADAHGAASAATCGASHRCVVAKFSIRFHQTSMWLMAYQLAGHLTPVRPPDWELAQLLVAALVLLQLMT